MSRPSAPHRSVLPVGVRAFTLRVGLPLSRAIQARRSQAIEPIRHVLVFDTETSTDVAQRLLFGVYRLCEIHPRRTPGPDDVIVIEEGLLYGDDLPQVDPSGFSALSSYVGHHAAETASGESRVLRLLSRTAFVNDVLYPFAYQGRGVVVGFNLPFDLSRLAVDAGPARNRGRWWPMGGGWSFVLWLDKRGKPHAYRPRLVIKHIDRNRSRIAFTSADHQPERRGHKGPPVYRGRFIDLKTLAFALTDKSHSLASACAAFDAVYRKHPTDRHGVVDEQYVDYCRQDVRATQALFEVAIAEFQRHPVQVPAWKVRSPATIVKGYLREMGVTPPLTRMEGITREQLGSAAAAYFGGQAEVRIRHTVVPVVATDVTSMYPTVNVLANLQRYLTAATLGAAVGTTRASATLRAITVDWLLDPGVWPSLCFFAEILPADDILPVRAKFGGEEANYTMSVNPYTSDEPAWYTGFDLARSVLLTGRVPQLRRAFRVVATGQLESLRAVALRSEVSIDPRTDDIFKRVIEARHRVKREAEEGTRSKASADGLERQLKVFANSGSYGIMAELNPEDGDRTRHQIRVDCGQAGFVAATEHPEMPGEFYFPPTAALITGGARLLLGLIERLVRDRGGYYLAVDTDSMHIVATEQGGLVPCAGGPDRMPTGEPAIRALSWAQVDEIVQTLDRLKPYGPDVRDSLLKIEKENFVDGVRTQLYGLATATKRYCLFNHQPDGTILIRKRSKHGLGVLLAPDRDPDAEPDEDEDAEQDAGEEECPE